MLVDSNPSKVNQSWSTIIDRADMLHPTLRMEASIERVVCGVTCVHWTLVFANSCKHLMGMSRCHVTYARVVLSFSSSHLIPQSKEVWLKLKKLQSALFCSFPLNSSLRNTYGRNVYRQYITAYLEINEVTTDASLLMETSPPVERIFRIHE